MEYNIWAVHFRMGKLPLGSEGEEMVGQIDVMAKVAKHRQINSTEFAWDWGWCTVQDDAREEVEWARLRGIWNAKLGS